MKKIFEKYPILGYIIGTFVKSFIFFAIMFVVILGLLVLAGSYTWVENALDLKYNSPFVLVPLYGFATLAVLCLVTGILMYFYKYKRSRVKSKFYSAFSSILNK